MHSCKAVITFVFVSNIVFSGVSSNVNKHSPSSNVLNSEGGNEEKGIHVTTRQHVDHGDHNDQTGRDGNQHVDEGAGLILTGLVEAGDLARARALAKVKGGPFPSHVTSYSGFFTVDPAFNSNLFFWFFPAQHDPENAPLILWLQGGPGEPSLFGLFNEVGPFKVAADEKTIIENPYSWHKNHSLLFIDSPVGAGFSFTESNGGYAKNQAQIANSLYSALKQFFKLFPNFRKNEFFIAGESYGGKYVPSLGNTIHRENKEADVKINLKGIAVGNGFTDPISMLSISEFVYQLGLVDYNFKTNMSVLEEKAIDAINKGLMEEASMNYWGIHALLTEGSHLKALNNILRSEYPSNTRYYENFVQSDLVRSHIHVGNRNFSTFILGGTAHKVFFTLWSEHMVSAKPYLEGILDHYRVLYFNGQLDIICAYVNAAKMFRTMNWNGKEEYSVAKRHTWYVGDDLAGYMKSAGKFTEVLVRNAGHMVSLDQPAWALDLITRFTTNNFTHQQSS